MKVRKASKTKIDWTKTPAYREAVLLKVLRSMKSYGFSAWMDTELRQLGLSI